MPISVGLKWDFYDFYYSVAPTKLQVAIVYLVLTSNQRCSIFYICDAAQSAVEYSKCISADFPNECPGIWQ